MKIVYCIFDCSSSGGTERALSLQANYFAGKGNEVHIVTTEKPSCKQNSYIFSDNISFHNLSINYREVDNSLSPLKIIYRIKIPSPGNLPLAAPFILRYKTGRRARTHLP